MDAATHINIIRRKKELLPETGEKIAKAVWVDLMEIIEDHSIDLTVDIYGIDPYDGPSDEDIRRQIEMTESLARHVLIQLSKIVQDYTKGV